MQPDVHHGLLALLAVAGCMLPALTACRRPPPAPPPLVAQVSGTVGIPGTLAPVRVVRDRWGVPHIYAQSQEDLFAAQGFVQAQDRLFQMDLWRRSAQGRLSEVLGPNFIDRDAMTRRMQYRGEREVEWASYGPDTEAIASAFVRGINAWVALARERPPEEFALAGWKPDFWSAVDLLNRTDAFVASGDARDEIRRAKMSDVVADAIRSVGAPPFFVGLAAQPVTVRAKPDAIDTTVRLQPDQVAGRSAGRALATRGGTLTIGEAHRTLKHPSARYVVHLHAPGWNVIGVTAPWRPGVTMGHNERIAWGMTAIDADSQDIYVEPAGVSKHVIKEPIVVKRRAQPFVFDIETTAHGVVVAVDRERAQAYTVRWSGFEPGVAVELAALAVGRAASWPEFRTALARWKTPAVRAVYADADGNVGFQHAALVPLRRSGEWVGWQTIDTLPHAFNPRGDSIPSADASGQSIPGPQRPGPQPAGDAAFGHLLAISPATRQRFNIGPLSRPADDDSPVRAVLDVKGWDRSRAMNAPGQSESPASTHFSDLAAVWSAGGSFPLVFSDAAVQANTESTLTLVTAQSPRR